MAELEETLPRRRRGRVQQPRAFAGAAVSACLAALLLAGGSPRAAEPEAETLVFGGDAAYPPFEWIEDGDPRGFNTDLAEALAAAGERRAEFRLGDWPGTLRALESGEVDVVPMFRSDAREKAYFFTPPFHFVNHGIYRREDAANIPSIAALDGETVAVEELSYAHQRLSRQDIAPTLVLTSNTVEALQAVAERRADFAILAVPTADYLIAERDLSLRSAGPPIWSRGYAFAVRRDRPELAEWLTEQFYAVLRSGAYHETFARWEDELTPAEDGLLSNALWLALIPAAALALGGLAWAIRLRGTVVARTKRLIDETKRRHAAESDANWRTNHDVYTDLPRLHHFTNQVDELLAGIEPGANVTRQIVALRPADLDRIIRTLGHEAGLAAMRDLVERLRAMGFEAYGQTGRDILLIFSDKKHVDRQLRKTLSPTDTLVMETTPLPRLYAGAAVWPKHGRTPSELIRRAETALAVATEQREGWREYRRAMDPDESTLQLIATFRETAAEGLYPVFQPQVDLRTGELVGAEVLARWNAPGFGNVPPDRFIPLLEDAGLIRHVTRRMLRHAVRVGADLRRRGMPCPISVNVSVADLLTDKTRKDIFKTLRSHDGRPDDLKLELTETKLAERPDAVGWVITRLRDNGIRTSIDDFGTGYSSLAYLSEFPIQEVKIDRSFVRGMANETKDRSIVRSTIAMAHELRLLVVAEGVETREQADTLRSDHCDRAQGYFYSKPLSEADLLRYVAGCYSSAAPSSQPERRHG